MRTKEIGDWGEQLAATYLEQQGFRILERQYRTKSGEIDIIARSGKTIVFVEVKTRRRTSYGKGVQSVDYRKQRRIIGAAFIYVQNQGISHTHMRFDVIEVYGEGSWSGDTVRIEHYENAFEVHAISSVFL